MQVNVSVDCINYRTDWTSVVEPAVFTNANAVRNQYNIEIVPNCHVDVVHKEILYKIKCTNEETTKLTYISSQTFILHSFLTTRSSYLFNSVPWYIVNFKLIGFLFEALAKFLNAILVFEWTIDHYGILWISLQIKLQINFSR